MLQSLVSDAVLILTAGALLFKTFSLKRDISDLKIYTKAICKKLDITCTLNGGK